MKRITVLFILAVIIASMFQSQNSFAYDFGDSTSITLVAKARKALSNADYDAVIAYAERCVELYEEKAKEMQAHLTEYPPFGEGGRPGASLYWALNDVGHILFLQAESYSREEKRSEAIRIYERIVSEFSFSQAKDSQGRIWRPAEKAKVKIEKLKQRKIDYGDYTTTSLVSKAWQAIEKKDYEAVRALAKKCIDLYADKAKEMQLELNDYPKGDFDINEKWALNGVATILFIEAESYRLSKENDKAREIYNTIINDFSYGQSDHGGSFWKPAERAKEKLESLETE